mmetsp:Transcript_5507/g.18477  ORF Transcript_5507/g.18477 Transcript_5507/m.18477 type:complete len:690 (+) Transcript_5507:2-2071(+)
MNARNLALALAVATAGAANVVLPCMTNYTLAVTPSLAAAPPPCSWRHYAAFAASVGDGSWADGTARVVTDAVGGVAAQQATEQELTSSLTTALTIVEALRLSLGDEAYASRTAAVDVDVVGWAFDWVERPVEEGTSNTVTVTPWEDVAAATAERWGSLIGGALRRLLPSVERVAVRGIGPEAPSLAATAMRPDGWLTLELVNGVYAPPAVAADVTLLENSGMHDDLWPSDGGCVSDKGTFAILTAAQLSSRVAAGRLGGLGLGCLWRSSVEAMVASGRLFWATSYQSHEHLLAVANLRGVGATIEHAFPSGFAEQPPLSLKLLSPSGLLAEALRDPYERAVSRKEALYAFTTALWRHRISVGGFEPTPATSRNAYVLAFRGAASAPPPAGSAAHSAYDALWRGHNTAQAVRRRLQSHACAAASLPDTPPRHAAVLRGAEWCGGRVRWPDEEPTPAPPRSAEASALFDSARKVADGGDAAGAAAAYRVALKASPSDAAGWVSLGVQLSAVDGAEDETLAAFEQAVAVAEPSDVRPPLTLARYFARLSRPAEAIAQFYAAAAADPEYFDEVKAGVGTARAQQGRLADALADFKAAARLTPQDARLARAVESMEQSAARLAAASDSLRDAVHSVCGTPCRDVVDASGTGVCAVTWAQGCGDTPPPDGFSADATVEALCPLACAAYTFRAQLG